MNVKLYLNEFDVITDLNILECSMSDNFLTSLNKHFWKQLYDPSPNITFTIKSSKMHFNYNRSVFRGWGEENIFTK